MRNIFNIILMATSLTSSVYAQTTTSTSDLKKAFYEYVDQIQEPIKKTRQAMSKIRTDCAVSLDQRLVFEDCKKSANQIKAAGDEIIKLAKISFESYNKILSIEAKNEVEASYKK